MEDDTLLDVVDVEVVDGDSVGSQGHPDFVLHSFRKAQVPSVEFQGRAIVPLALVHDPQIE